MYVNSFQYNKPLNQFPTKYELSMVFYQVEFE